MRGDFAKIQLKNGVLNLVDVFWQRVERYDSRPALLYKQGGRYRPISWKAWAAHVKNTALGLHALGVRKGDRVGILSENRPEWTYADLGILSLGALTVPIYPTSSAQEIAYVLKHAGVQVLFAGSEHQIEKIRSDEGLFSGLKKIIFFDGSRPFSEKVTGLDALLARGRWENLNNESFYETAYAKVAPDDIATLIYTSGTTGPSKGVMLTHRNFMENCVGTREYFRVDEGDLSLSFLPLSHVFERMAGYYFMMWHGATIAYAENMQTVGDDMRLIHPTVAAAVPRFYEKTYDKILEAIEASPPWKRKIFDWAVKTGRQRAEKIVRKEAIPCGLKMACRLAEILVFRKINRRLGGRIRCFISGGAPLAKELAEFFYSAGVLILEGYGLTETSPVISVNQCKDFKFGTVGRVIPNMEVKIAEDGEILVKGPCIMKGYYENEAATQEAIRDGWFYTGDIGCFDRDGFLKITDRKKDLIVTAGGKNIPPQNIENLLREDPLFEQVVVIGDKRPYLVALIVTNSREIEHHAQSLGLEARPYGDLLKEQKIHRLVEEKFKEKLSHLASFEQVKYFALLEKELTQAAGELTPTMKVKRKVVQEKYRDLIESLYQKGRDQLKSQTVSVEPDAYTG